MHQRALYTLVIGILLLGAVSSVFAEEGGTGEEEHKAKPPEKAKPDSAVSFVANLPEVKKWEQWISSQNNGKSLSIWGEEVLQHNGNSCSDVAVAETDASGDNTKVWIRFCVTSGGSVLVESTPRDPVDDIKFIPYDDWRKSCNPTYKSPGIC